MKHQDVVKNIEKKYGKEALVGSKVEVDWLPSGSLALDLALGGGYAKGRVIEIFGWESSGKTTLAIHAAAACQKEGKKVGYVDMENAFDVEYAEALGVNVDFNDSFIFSQPDDGETAIGILLELLNSEDIGLIVFDSIGALLPKAVIQGEVGDAKMALAARLLSQELPKIAQKAKKANCTVIFINQKREKIGVMFGNPETTMGGNAMKFYASQRLEINKSGQEKDGDEVTAVNVKAKVIKNKVAPPFKKAEFLIRFGEGIDSLTELINLAVDFSIINKSGSWYSYQETKLGQGRESVRVLLGDNPELYEEIQLKLYETLGL